MAPGRSITKTASSPNILPRPFGSPSELSVEIDPMRLSLITGFIKLLLNPFMTNHSYNPSRRRLREWVQERLVGAAAFPLGKRIIRQIEGDIFTSQLRGHIDFA